MRAIDAGNLKRRIQMGVDRTRQKQMLGYFWVILEAVIRQIDREPTIQLDEAAHMPVPDPKKEDDYDH